MLRVIVFVGFDDLAEIPVRAERLLNRIPVRPESIAGNLYAGCQPTSQIADKHLRGRHVSLAAPKRGNQLRFRVNRAERPDIAVLRVVINAQMALFLSDESTNFVKLQVMAR